MLPLTKRSGAIFCSILALGIFGIELLLPLNGDNWVYQSMGWDLFAYGKLPYLGSWDVNFPGIVYLHALSIAVFGRSDFGFRIFDLVIEVSASLLLYKLLTRWFEPFIAIIASMLYPLFCVSLGWWVAGQRDAVAVFFLLAGLELFFEAIARAPFRSVNGRAVLAGFLIAFCAIIRPTFGLWPVSVCMAYVLTIRRIDRNIWSFLGGAFLALVGLFLPYALSSNGLRDFYRFAILFNVDVYSRFSQPASVFFVAPQVPGVLAAACTLAGLLTLGCTRMWRRELFPAVPRFAVVLYLMLLTSSFVSIFLMHSFFLYQYVPLLALLSPIMAYAVFAPALVRSRWIALPAVVLLMGYLSYRLYPRNLLHDARTAFVTHKPVLDYLYTTIENDTLTGYVAEKQAVAYLREAGAGKRPIEVICYNRPYLRVPAGLESATRFSEILPLTMTTRTGTFTSYQQEWRREFVEELEAVRPQFIVFANIPAGLLTLERPVDLANSIPGFSSFVAEHYRLDTVIRGFTFYKLQEGGRQ